MNKQTYSAQEATELRQYAERECVARSEVATGSLMTGEKRLLHELQVHQIELQIQNESLQEALIIAERAQENYTELFDSAPIAYFTLGHDGVIQKANFRGANLLGIERSKLSGQLFINYVSSHDRPLFNRFLENIFSTDHKHICELTLRIGDTYSCLAIESIADKTRQSCLLAALDITERKAHENAIKASEAKFRSIIDVSPVPMILNDEQLHITYLNPAFVQLFGYDLADIPTLADWCLKAFPDPDYRHWVKTGWRMAQEKSLRQTAGFPPLELVIHCKNNALKTILATDATIRNDFSDEHLAIYYDITQRKQTEAKLNAIFNAAVEGIITCGMSKGIVSANSAIETIFGYKPEELIGCNIHKLIPLLPKNSSDCNYCLHDAVGPVSQVLEVEGIRKNGAAVPLDMSRAAYSIDNECYATYIVRDVSLRKQREQQDREHLNELAHVTRLGLMGEMASGIAHEVNQPLTAVAIYTQASLNLINSENFDPVDLADILTKTHQQALRAGQIIHRMREFIKTKSQRCSTIEINPLIQEAANLCSDGIKQNGIQLTYDLENNLPPIYADHIQIEQVLINLIRNSIDVLQSLPETQQRHLSIHCRLTADDRIEVRVKDNGPGMDEDQKLKILTPFYSTKTAGMGMGLSISRSLIESHGGTLHFNSKPGKGSSFYFTLPVHRDINGN